VHGETYVIEVQCMTLRLLSAKGANCCERIQWVLDYKAMAYDLLDADAPEHAGELREFSPFGRVPVLLTADGPISESMAIAEYLEELEPEPALLGATPLERVRVREVCEAINSSIHPIQNGSAVRLLQPTWSNDEVRAF